MREFKFRAWDKLNKEMIENIWIAPEYNWELFSDNDALCERGKAKEDQIILMQYTGLKDKNGKEIYEGDICKNGDMDSNAHCYNYRIEELRWDTESAMFSGWNYNTGGMTCEVIGNICENPELLE